MYRLRGETAPALPGGNTRVMGPFGEDETTNDLRYVLV